MVWSYKDGRLMCVSTTRQTRHRCLLFLFYLYNVYVVVVVVLVYGPRWRKKCQFGGFVLTLTGHTRIQVNVTIYTWTLVVLSFLTWGMDWYVFHSNNLRGMKGVLYVGPVEAE